jgi:hypothetical protein
LYCDSRKLEVPGIKLRHPCQIKRARRHSARNASRSRPHISLDTCLLVRELLTNNHLHRHSLSIPRFILSGISEASSPIPAPSTCPKPGSYINRPTMAPDLNSLPPSRSRSTSGSLNMTRTMTGEGTALRGQSPSPSPRSASTSLQAAAAVNAGLQQEDSRRKFKNLRPASSYQLGGREMLLKPRIFHVQVG